MTRQRQPFVAFATLATAVLATALVAASAGAQAASATEEKEEKAVLATVQRMFDAMRTKDTVAFRETFLPSATLVGMRARPTGEQTVQVLTWERFGAFMAGDKRAAWIERAWSPEVRIRGTLATVWAEYDFHFGQTPSHCGVDAVQLLKTPTGWQIASIADTYETTGCPMREPPR